jgi:hypothetical protein
MRFRSAESRSAAKTSIKHIGMAARLVLASQEGLDEPACLSLTRMSCVLEACIAETEGSLSSARTDRSADTGVPANRGLARDLQHRSV